MVGWLSVYFCEIKSDVTLMLLTQGCIRLFENYNTENNGRKGEMMIAQEAL